MLVNVEISGISPLLQHKFGEEQEKTKKGSGQRLATQDYSAEELEHLYQTKKGEVYQPSSHIEGCMTKAATEFFIKGHKGKRFTDRVKAFVDVYPTEIVHKNQDWHVDSRSVVIQRQRVMRRRPCFAKWGLEFQINIRDPGAMPPTTLHEILEYGGRYVGIGDYRPKFGQFEVVKWEVVEKK
jgi:hypothetical protein